MGLTFARAKMMARSLYGAKSRIERAADGPWVLTVDVTHKDGTTETMALGIGGSFEAMFKDAHERAEEFRKAQAKSKNVPESKAVGPIDVTPNELTETVAQASIDAAVEAYEAKQGARTGRISAKEPHHSNAPRSQDTKEDDDGSDD